MIEILQDVFKKGLDGYNSHINPEKAISDLDSRLAKINLDGFPHSIWDLLHHMVTWQDVVINSIKGKDIDWDDISKNKNWPTLESKEDDSNFDKLKNRFIEGIQQVSNIIKTADLSKPIPSWRNIPNMQAIMIVITHNSYHLGQIMVLKKNFIDKNKET
ncbi:MAG: DinB family protein [Candidatus Heimdallarchaeota archaeon]|nr:DinB family protein [Candidatus Heimdallarchaeota archaeon]MCK4878875.1 DinB family protein [Candidatus Heimdallarchaeota archaeon]